MFNYTSALIRTLSNNFPKSICKHKPLEPINLEKAHQQHTIYTDHIKKLITNVYTIEEDDNCPDCVFIEDTCVIFDNKAVITNLGHHLRKPEIIKVQEKLLELKLELFWMKEPATLDGGDVLITNHEILVGISERTNMDGYEFLKDIFKKVRPILVKNGLHLKSLISLLDYNTIVVVDNDDGQEIIQQIQSTDIGYDIIKVPDVECANVLRIKNCVLIQKGFLRSENILEDEICDRGLECIKVEMSEFIKADGALTCCNVLF